MLKPVKTLLILLFVIVTFSGTAYAGYTDTPLSREQFNQWPQWPEYTVFNFFPSKGKNCTWYAHGRMMQLGYCKYALDSMRFNANTWAREADRGAEVTDQPFQAVIAFWDSGAYFGSALGHVAVVEAVLESGAILISESSSSASPYNTRLIEPASNIWPTAFIKVPKMRDPSVAFSCGDYARVMAGNLNFRVEGVNQSPVLLEQDTVLAVKEHPSNGLYASQPGSVTEYHHWWYAAYDTGEEALSGWVAETYLKPTGDHVLQTVQEKEPAADLVSNKINGQKEEEGEEEALPEAQIVCGDVCGNGLVDVRDVNLVMRYILHMQELEPEQKMAADVNIDGLIDIKDVSIMMRFVLGMIESF